MSIPAIQLLIGAAVAGAIALAAYKARMLARSGAWGAFLLGGGVFGLGGIAWSAPVVAFFITGSLLSKFGPKRKRGLEEVFEKGSTRDVGQVLANGGIGGVIAIIHAVAPDPALSIAFLGTFAAAAADTWGTEIGVLGRGRALGLPWLRFVERGTSGGVSLVGSVGALAGAATVAASGSFFDGVPVSAFPIAVAAGMIGMLADSIAGGALQARYCCDTCGKITEQRVHCGAPSRLTAGHRTITNDAVNTICTVVGALAAYLLARLL